MVVVSAVVSCGGGVVPCGGSERGGSERGGSERGGSECRGLMQWGRCTVCLQVQTLRS